MIKLQTLEPKAVQIIMPRVNDELTARYFYESAMAWCRTNGYSKAAHYFKNEAKQENKHYKNWIKFLSDWNVDISFPIIESPMKFTSLIDILEQQYNMEYGLYEAYEQDAIKIFPLCPTIFGIIQKYMKIQNDSVIESNDLIAKAYNYIGSDPKLVLFESENF